MQLSVEEMGFDLNLVRREWRSLPSSVGVEQSAVGDTAEACWIKAGLCQSLGTHMDKTLSYPQGSGSLVQPFSAFH